MNCTEQRLYQKVTSGDSRTTVFTFLKNSLKLLKDKALEIIPKYGRIETKFGLRIAERTIMFETLQLILAL